MKRIPELDAVRGLAALVILGFHLWWLGLFLPSTAVDCFFVLSGFLITTIVLKYQDSPSFLTRFYMRRGLRIWPIYYLAVLGVAAVNPFLREPAPMDGLPYVLTYTQNIQYYWSDSVPPISPLLDHTWTLALEEQFYLLWPPLIVLLGRRRVIPLALAVMATSVWARAAGYYPKGPLIARADGFALGGLLAAVLIDDGLVRRRLGSFRLGFALLGLVALSYPAWGRLLLRDRASGATILSLNLFFVTVLYTAIVGLVVTWAGHRALAPLRDRRLVYLGQISYGLYLYHPLVFALVDGLGGRAGLPRSIWLDLAKILATVAVAAFSWRFIETPILALKSRFDYRPTPSPSPPHKPPHPTVGAEPARELRA